MGAYQKESRFTLSDIFNHVRANIAFVSPDNNWGFAEVINPDNGDKRTWMCHRLGRRDAFATPQGTVTYPDARVAQGPMPLHGDAVVIMYERAPHKEGQYPQAVWTTAEQYDPVLALAGENRASFAAYAAEQQRITEQRAELEKQRAELEKQRAEKRAALEPKIQPLQQRFAIKSLTQTFDPAMMTRVVVTQVERDYALAKTEDDMVVILPWGRQHLLFLAGGNPPTAKIGAAPAATTRFPEIGEGAFVRSAYVAIVEVGEADLVIEIRANAWVDQAQADKTLTAVGTAMSTLAVKAAKAEEVERQRQADIARARQMRGQGKGSKRKQKQNA
jgi:hypothetical protein